MSDPAIIYLKALNELVEATKEADPANRDLMIRQSAEKAWLSVVKATDKYLASKNIHVSNDQRAHSERRAALRTLHQVDWSRIYADLSQSLHGEIFYMGESLSDETIKQYFTDAATYVGDIVGDESLGDETLRRLHSVRISRD